MKLQTVFNRLVLSTDQSSQIHPFNPFKSSKVVFSAPRARNIDATFRVRGTQGANFGFEGYGGAYLQRWKWH